MIKEASRKGGFFIIILNELRNLIEAKSYLPLKENLSRTIETTKQCFFYHLNFYIKIPAIVADK